MQQRRERTNGNRRPSQRDSRNFPETPGRGCDPCVTPQHTTTGRGVIIASFVRNCGAGDGLRTRDFLSHSQGNQERTGEFTERNESIKRGDESAKERWMRRLSHTLAQG
jgi:hypothetical protein